MEVDAAIKKITEGEPITEENKDWLKKFYKGLIDDAIQSADKGRNTAISVVM